MRQSLVLLLLLLSRAAELACSIKGSFGGMRELRTIRQLQFAPPRKGFGKGKKRTKGSKFCREKISDDDIGDNSAEAAVAAPAAATTVAPTFVPTGEEDDDSGGKNQQNDDDDDGGGDNNTVGDENSGVMLPAAEEINLGPTFKQLSSPAPS